MHWETVLTSKDCQVYPICDVHKCARELEGCEITLRADMATVKKQLPHPPRISPYHALPHMSLNVTNALVVKGAYGIVWVKSEDGTCVGGGRQTSKEYLMLLAHEAAGSSNGSNYGASGGSITVFVGIVVESIASTALVGALIALMVFEICKVKSKHLSTAWNIGIPVHLPILGYQ